MDKETIEAFYRNNFGMYKGHYKWDLTKAWLQMSNDDFYRLFGFNWVPPMWMHLKAQKFIE